MKKPSGLSLYWKCQLIGWSVASIYWGLMGYLGTNFNWNLAIVHFVIDVMMYIGLTHLFKMFSFKMGWHKLMPKQLIKRIIPSVLVLGIGYALITTNKNYLMRVFFEPFFEGSNEIYLDTYNLTMLVTGIRLMSIWVLAYYGYHYTQRELLAVKESARLAVVAKDAQLQNLYAQLNPHFFFNSLNSIKALVTIDPSTAKRAIDLLSELMRTSLYGKTATLITVEQEMKLIEDYLELEAMRFDERLKVNIIIEKNAGQAKILPLSIQTLVENAIKHGIAKRKAGGLIELHVYIRGNNVVVNVKNPGKLQRGENGIGLKNLKERLLIQFNGKAFFQLAELKNEVVEAIINIPL